MAARVLAEMDDERMLLEVTWGGHLQEVWLLLQKGINPN